MKLKIATLVFCFCLLIQLVQAQNTSDIAPSSPFSFIENKGQWNNMVLFKTHQNGFNLWLTKNGLVYDFYKKNIHSSDFTKKLVTSKNNLLDSVMGQVVKLELLNCNVNITTLTHQKQASVYNYLIGNEPSKWVTNVGLYNSVELVNIYNKINQVFYFEKNKVRYDYILQPGANVTSIQIQPKGCNNYSINSKGELVFTTLFGEVKQANLFAYQLIDGAKQKMECKFIKNADGTIGINSGWNYKNQPLIIDPLIFSTYVGGSQDDVYYFHKLDGAGNIILIGSSNSNNYPTTFGAYHTNIGGMNDVILTKMNSNGSGLVYSTFLGGSNNDAASIFDVDRLGNIVIGGFTSSSNFPTTSGVYSTTLHVNGLNADNFITKLNQSANTIIFSTFVGGSDDEYIAGLKLDKQQNILFAGSTLSSNYPTTSGAYDTTFNNIINNGDLDGYVTKLDSVGSSLVYSTFIGGNSSDFVFSMDTDDSDFVYISGNTYHNISKQNNYPTTTGCFSTLSSNTGVYEGFISKLNLTGTALQYSTLVYSNIGSNNFFINAMVVDSFNVVYFTGNCNYSGRLSGYSPSYNYPQGSDFMYIAKFYTLNNCAYNPYYFSMVGSDFNTTGYSIFKDSKNYAYVTGVYSGSPTYSSSLSGFPNTTNAIKKFANGGDAVVVVLDSVFQLKYATQLGGSNGDYGYCISSNSNSIFVSGYTESNFSSNNFPTTPNVFDTIYNQGKDAFICKLDFQACPNFTIPPITIPIGCTGDPVYLNSPYPNCYWATRYNSTSGFLEFYGSNKMHDTITNSIGLMSVYFTYSQPNGCMYATPYILAGNNNRPKLSYSIFPNDTICNGESVAITGHSANSNTWVINGINDSSIVLNPNITAQYILKVKDTTVNCSSSDTLTIYTEICAGINAIGNNLKIGIYPNPSENELNFTGINDDLYWYEIIDITGRSIYQNQPLTNNKINISNLATGNYVVKLHQRDIITNLKFSKIEKH